MNEPTGDHWKQVKRHINKQLTVLLIEDDVIDQERFMDALHTIKHIKLSGIVLNGLQAMKWLYKEERLPDFIFTDLNMPVLNDLKLISSLKSNVYTRKVPIVVYSNDKQKARYAMMLGAKSVVVKGTSLQELASQLQLIIHPWLWRISLPFLTSPIVLISF